MPAARAQAAHRVDARLGAAERVQRQRAPPPVARDDRGNDVRAAGVDDGCGAQRGGLLSAPADTSTATTCAPGGHRDLHRREPDAAAAVHGDPLPGPHPALLDDGAEGGRVAAAQRRGGGERHGVRQRDQVDVGGLERDELGERPPVREAGLRLGGADLVVAGRALRRSGRTRRRTARSRGRRPRHRRTLGADRLDGPGQLVPGTCGRTMSGSWPCQPCQSLRQTPVAPTRTTTPAGDGTGAGTSCTVSGPPKRSKTSARTYAQSSSMSMSWRAASVTEPDSDG